MLAATSGPDGIVVESLGWEVDAIAVRGVGRPCLESADRARHDAFEVLDHLVARQLGTALVTGAPVLLPGLPLVLAVGGDGLTDALDLVTDNPLLVQHLVNGGGGLLAGLTGGLLPTSRRTTPRTAR